MVKPKCTGCASCCNDVSVELDKPTNFDDFETIKWMIAHENVTVFKDNENEWLVEFKTKCKELDKKNRCNVYETRSTICRNHQPDECITNAEGEYFKIMFRTDADVDKYMKKIGFYKKYMIAKKKQLEKANKK